MSALVLFVWIVGVIAVVLFVALLMLVNATLDLLHLIQADLTARKPAPCPLCGRVECLWPKRKFCSAPLGLS